MGALLVVLFFMVIAFVAVYALALVIVAVGAMGWYLSFPVLAAITVLLAAWPVLSYRRILRYSARSFWYEEGEKLVLIGFALLIIWGCALRDQLSTLWGAVSPYVLR